MDLRDILILILALACVQPALAQNSKKGNVYIQSTERYQTSDQKKALSLRAAIEQALRANYAQNQRDFSQEILDLNWEDTKEAFWLPQLSMTLEAGPQRIGRLKTGAENTQGLARRPDGSLTLGFQDYTIFNWGKDYLAYLNNKESYKRSTTRFKEQRRALKHDAIIKYFELAFRKKVEKTYRRALRHASFVYRYSREKVSIKKIKKQEYYQARSEFLRAQNAYQEADRLLKVAEEEMAFLLTDKPGTSYILKDKLHYQKLQIPMEDAVKIAAKNNPQIRESTKDVKNAKRSYEIQLRENLPLPEFKVNLGAYRHRMGPGLHTTRYDSGVTGNHIDVRASLNATWSLTGVGGFFNQRTTERALINRHLSFNQLTQAKHQTQSEIRRAYYRLKTYEQQIRILEASQETNTKSFDVTLENYLNQKTTFLNFQDALLESISSDISLAQMYYNHTREKVLLAQEMGVDEFPGKSFEQLGEPKENP